MESTKRVNKFHGNVPAWLSLSEIDYFTQFVKAWIPFNAWFSTTYYGENQDREIINKIKRETNPFRDKIVTYLLSSDIESSEFCRNIGKLHVELDHVSIPSLQDKICFRAVIVSKNTLSEHFIKLKEHLVTVNYNHKAVKGIQKVNTKVIELKGYLPKMDWSQNDWDIEELQEHPNFKKIGTYKNRKTLQDTITQCYQEVNPFKPVNLVVEPLKKGRKNPTISAPTDCIKIDPIKHIYFIKDAETIAKGLVEILYRLRNALFHGEINPSPDTQKVYREAYYILNTLLKAL
jgi:hypothetical protein